MNSGGVPGHLRIVTVVAAFVLWAMLQERLDGDLGVVLFRR